ncbi:hypothetical protein V1638_04160 [Pseudarthrobacter sp. J64]|uniref:HNH endonuclease n=1 Tax=Pseudarthrobacter sp. J64 TaxID=3116485 RepID=UPI002E81C755|nr:hypothetical protein [Pseudarthrobacter sp. J64]MEE2568590.1 hypothetical protein [Pseudarthrobacter sp. J64]
MSWVKASDKAATFPKALNAPHFSKGEISVNEVFGFVLRCAFESAAHTTDYVIEYGVAMMMGGAKYEQLLAVSEQCGLMEQIEADGAPSWKIIEDKDFIHLITKAQQEWMQQQQRDSRDTKLTSAVRVRDGDACRYCSKIVYFGGDKKSARSGGYARTGTMDHVISGEAGTYETLVVACGECNSRKKNNDDALVLLPPPAQPFYSQSTAAFLAKHGYQVTPSDRHPAFKKKASTADGTPSAPPPVERPTEATPGSTQASEAVTGQGSGADSTPGSVESTSDRNTLADQADRNPSSSGPPQVCGSPVQPDPVDRLPGESGLAGSGLGPGLGSGRAGQGGQPATPGEPSQKPRSRKRRRPRNRGRNQA